MHRVPPTPDVSPRRLTLRVVLLLCALGATSDARAQAVDPSPWSASVQTERASVSNQGRASTWNTRRVQIGWNQPGVGGFSVGAEQYRRDGLTDVPLFAQAYRRAGDWTVVAGGGATSGAMFVYRHFVEGEVARRIAGTVVAAVNVRSLRYTDARVNQLQPSVTWYHARGELGVRWISTTNTTLDRHTTALVVRGYHDVTPRLRVSAGAARGTRIFDVAALTAASARSRSASASVRVGVTRHDFLEVGGTDAHEDPAYTYRSFLVGYRRVF